MTHRTGFTLVEILIVVIILGILAAIVIPQFTEASNDARESALASDLQTLRSQIELYKVQHLEMYPGQTSAKGDPLVIVAADFVTALTSKTELDGSAPEAGDTTYGPYLQKIPTNPFNDLNTVEINGTLGGGSHGWNFSTTTEQIHPDDDNHKAL